MTRPRAVSKSNRASLSDCDYDTALDGAIFRDLPLPARRAVEILVVHDPMIGPGIILGSIEAAAYQKGIKIKEKPRAGGGLP